MRPVWITHTPSQTLGIDSAFITIIYLIKWLKITLCTRKNILILSDTATIQYKKRGRHKFAKQ